MKLDETIKEFTELAKADRREQNYWAAERDETSPFDNVECNRLAEDAETRADYNEQLAEWLRELQELREKVSGGDVMRICELEKANEHLREWNRKLTDLKNEFMCKYDESQEELQKLREKHWDECRQIAHYDNDLKEVIKLTGTTIETALENLDAKDLIRELAKYLYEAVDGFRALGKYLDDHCKIDLDCEKCPLQNGGNCRSWKHTKAVLKLIGGI